MQALWAARRAAAGHRIVGHKIGLTSRAMQAATGITEPDYGVIFDDMVFESGVVVPFENYSNVRIEVELAFVLARPLSGPECTLDEVLAATEYVVPALEILNSHIQLEGRTIVDTISDNAAMGAMVLGDTRVAVDDVDLRWVERAALPQPDDRGDRSRRRCPRTIPPTASPGSPTSSSSTAPRWEPARSS